MDQDVLRAINSGLLIVERNIRALTKELREDPDSEWILRKSVSDVNKATVRQLTEKSDLMLNEIRELEQACKLSRNVDSRRWRLTTNLPEIWSILNELTPDGLRGYGTMTQQESELLTTHINKMTTLCNEMRNALSNQT